ncbi:hypothetical protein DPEC_G00075030, partial [Dallia pectoralis]
SRGEGAGPTPPHIPNLHGEKNLLQPQTGQSLINCDSGACGNKALNQETKRLSPVVITVRSSGETVPIGETVLIENPVTDWDSQSPVSPYSRRSPFYTSESAGSSLNIMSTLPPNVDTEPVTMIFMGFQDAEEEEDDENIQAELIVFGNGSGDEDDHDDDNMLSYHPVGYQSKIFQPTVKCDDIDNATEYWNTENLRHLPTFTHKPGKHSLSSFPEDPTTL